MIDVANRLKEVDEEIELLEEIECDGGLLLRMWCSFAVSDLFFLALTGREKK